MNITYKRVSTFYRLAAFIIDCIILSLISKILIMLSIESRRSEMTIFVAFSIVLYFILMEKKGTIGKRIFSLVLLKRETQTPELYTVVIRAILKLLFFSAVSCLFFEFLNHNKDSADIFTYVFCGVYTALNLYCFFTTDRHFIHDSITSTTVYKEDKQ